MNLKKEKIFKIIYWLSLFGIIVASYSLYEYYYGTADGFCNINERFSCFAVYKSGYSAIFGVPIALLGVIGYGIFFTLSHWGLSGRMLKVSNLIFSLALMSVVFSGYLAYVSGFVIKVWCPTCVASYVLTLAVFACSVVLKKESLNNLNIN